MTLQGAVRVTRALSQAKCQYSAKQFLGSVEADLHPTGVPERKWPKMSDSDLLQLRLAQCATENPLWHEYVMGRHKNRSKRELAKQVLIDYSQPLLSWSAVPELFAQINFAGPVPKKDPELGRCWLWAGKKHKNGYGYFYVPKYNVLGQRMKHGGKILPTYVVTFILDRGRYPKPIARHMCHNALCVNPRHMRNGTAGDNAKDRQRAGRTRGYTACMTASLAEATSTGAGLN